ALLAAPAAFAADTPAKGGATASASAPAAGGKAADDAHRTGSTHSASPAAPGTAQEPAKPAAHASATPSGKPSASASATPSAKPTGPVECRDGDEPVFDDQLTSELTGLPSKVVAGSGWHPFTLNLANTSGRSHERVDLGVFAAAIDESNGEPQAGHLKLEFKNPDTGAWEAISLRPEDENAGYTASTAVKAHTAYTLDLRLSVDAGAPGGTGFVIQVGMYANGKGECVYAGGQDAYMFDILKANAKPGHVPDAEPRPQGGRKPLPAQPVGNKVITPVGHLAETGSSSATPTIAMVGGAAVVVGAGALFMAKRRKSGNTA
ncbi:LAETG motif-containing sortase-dependent surface protein, partial [Streptomyces sp. NPDC049577]|uniref:LAETG motif-containing sortase-dependent surface protein n=1 Tax=Streptomyces sp. NPDC049577 TaxID=3155153 RepID=UPI003434EFAE